MSTSTAADTNTTIVATGGTLTIGGATISVTGPVTLQGLADTINADSECAGHRLDRRRPRPARIAWC